MPIRPSRRRRVNPYFRQRQSGISRTYLVRGGLGVVFLLILGLLFYTPWLHVGSVDVRGAGTDIAERIDAQVSAHLDRRAFLLFPRTHRWFLQQGKISTDLMESLPLNRADISREGRVLVVDVQEKIRTFYVLRDDVLYAVDRNGLVLSRVDDLERARLIAEPGRIPMIEDVRGGELREGDEVVSAEHLAQIVVLFDAIQARTMLTPTGAILADEEGRVDVETDADVTLYVNVAKELDPQIDKLSALIDRKLVDITTLQYIDLRFTNRLFYN